MEREMHRNVWYNSVHQIKCNNKMHLFNEWSWEKYDEKLRQKQIINKRKSFCCANATFDRVSDWKCNTSTMQASKFIVSICVQAVHSLSLSSSLILSTSSWAAI